jgi:hypothetical protein
MVVLLVAYAALRLWRRYELVANGRHRSVRQETSEAAASQSMI